MGKNSEDIAATLGVTRVIKVPDTGGGAFGAARRGHIVATIQDRVVPGPYSPAPSSSGTESPSPRC